MVTQSLLNQYRSEVESASNDARNYLTAMCEAYIDVNPNATVADMRKFAIETLQDGLYLYGDQAKVIANDFFDTLAQQEGSKATADMFDSTDADMVKQKVRYYAKAMAEGDTSKFIKDVSDLTGYYVKREAFCNMAKNCDKHGIRYARVPSGRETCAFCFMLASRGFVYWTEADAGEQMSGHEYHTNCDCIIVPGFHKSSGVDEDTQIEGYKPSEMRDRYKKSYDAINPNGTWDEVYKQWKNSETEDTWEKFKTKALVKEINTRDWGWLWNGKEPSITFETPELEIETKTKRPQEIETAERLVKQGVRADFRIDYKEVWNEERERIERVGLSDFSNGYEIKTLKTATSHNTINSYLKNASRKEDCKAVVFDNTNNAISNEDLERVLVRLQSFHEGRVYILDGENYWRVR